MVLRIYNTRSRRKEPFEPREPPLVRMYVCGPTTYDYSHLGHAKSYVSFDTVRRYLEYLGFRVDLVQNFTDIEEVILRRSALVAKPPLEYAQFYIDAFLQDMRDLKVTPATHYTKVSEHILEIQTLIALLIEREFAYPIGGDVYFRTRRAKRSFGVLTHQKFEDVVLDPLPPGSKREDPLDFALWRASKEGEPSWSSPWGPGRPGWHVECNAMAFKYLGAPLDIHGGGSDLKFPHHESEAMICEGAWGVDWTRIWMHNGFLTLEQDKMSKSLGNFVTIRSVLAEYPGEVVRQCLLKAHYREDVEYDKDCFRRTGEEYASMRAAIAAAQAAHGPGTDGKVDAALEVTKAGFLAAMDDDFNTPDAIYRLLQLTEALEGLSGVSRSEGQRIVDAYRELGGILGLFSDVAGSRAGST